MNKITPAPITFLCLFMALPILLNAQKKVLDHSDYALWNTIQGEVIAPNGDHVLYSFEKGEKDNYLKIQDAKGIFLLEYDRGQRGHFTNDSRYALFTITAWKDSIIAMKKRKVKKKKMPKDTLAIFDLKTKELLKIANVKSFKLPGKWSGYLAYQLEETHKKEGGNDTLSKAQKKKDKPKKVGKKNGYHLVVRNLGTKQEDTIKFVTDYRFAKKGKRLAYTTTGLGKGNMAGVFVRNLNTHETIVLHQAPKANYLKLGMSDLGDTVGFIVDADTTKALKRNHELYLWEKGHSMAKKLVDSATAPNSLLVSKHGKIHFSEDGSKMYFGLAKPPIEKDTSLLEEEIVNVEVWTYDDPKLYTVQEVQLKNDSVQSFVTAINLKNKKITPIANTTYTDAVLGDKGNANIALVRTGRPYELPSQWTARRYYDYRGHKYGNGGSAA